MKNTPDNGATTLGVGSHITMKNYKCKNFGVKTVPLRRFRVMRMRESGQKSGDVKSSTGMGMR